MAMPTGYHSTGIDVSGPAAIANTVAGRKPANQPLPDMVGPTTIPVADAAWEQFNQPCRDRGIDQRHIDHQQPEHDYRHDLIDLGRIGRSRIAMGLDRRGQCLGEIGLSAESV